MTSLTTMRAWLTGFQQAGVLDVADVHTAGQVCRMAGETSEKVMLVLALAVRALRHGSVCLELDRIREIGVDSAGETTELVWPNTAELVTALRVSPLAVGSPHGPLRPLVLADSDAGPLLYLDRYFRQEQLIRHALVERESDRPSVDVATATAALRELFVDESGAPTGAPDRQRIAAAMAASEWTAIVAGGPGTGKTHTVARILALLFRLSGPDIRVALAAPTGKAAAALTEAVAGQAGALGIPGLTATTLHRLLGWRRGSSTRFRHDARNRLPFDVVVIDETSMVSLTLMARLFEALAPTTRLILVGDPDQLTSVDAGAVLADLVARRPARSENTAMTQMVAADLADGARTAVEPALDGQDRARIACGVVRLRRGHRFNRAIRDLADAVRLGDSESTVSFLASGGVVSLHGPHDVGAVRAIVGSSAVQLLTAAEDGDVEAALAALGQHRLLCAHREGPFGQRHWAQRAVEWTVARTGRAVDPDDFYPGQPLLVTANDYQAGVFNGDIGVVVATDGGLMAAIERGGAPLLVHPTVLSSVQTAYAMTIHRSQGSQYRAVTVVLPEADSPLLSRQLLYTAITRARDQVRIIGTEEAVVAAVSQQVRRASGLRMEVREANQM
jgi:exodeoxyribonuclease V alpha subunit